MHGTKTLTKERTSFPQNQKALTHGGNSVRKFFFRGLLVLIILLVAVPMLFVAFSWNRESNSINLTFMFNHTMKHMLTDSMEPDIPAGSLILIQRVNPEELEIGDVITFAVDQRTTATHQILSIFPDYIDGQIGFQTGGYDRIPDSTIVSEWNVIGQVVFYVPRLGAVLSKPQNLIWLLLAFFVIIVIACYKRFASIREKGKNCVERVNQQKRTDFPQNRKH